MHFSDFGVFPPQIHLAHTLSISVLEWNIYATYCTHRIQSTRLFFADKYYVYFLAGNANAQTVVEFL